jgi:hypothetical protein
VQLFDKWVLTTKEPTGCSMCHLINILCWQRHITTDQLDVAQQGTRHLKQMLTDSTYAAVGPATTQSTQMTVLH